MKRMSRIPAQQGLTLVELMITLVVLAVVLEVSAPSFARLKETFQLRSSTHRLVAAINLARTEALERRQSVSLCPSLAGAVCSGDYSSGWLLFRDTDQNQQFDPATEKLILRSPGLPGGYTVSDRSGASPATEAITYGSDGSAYRNQTLLLCGQSALGVEPYAIVLNLVGRVRVARGEGTCPGATG